MDTRIDCNIDILELSMIEAFQAVQRPSLEELVACANPEHASELLHYVAPYTWQEIARLTLPPAAPQEFIDLGTIFYGMSRKGMQYYLPGFLIHFLRFGNYGDSKWGPTFFYNFVRRLQPDNERVRAAGGCRNYFRLNDEQERLCANALWCIYISYGDEYENSPDFAYEYSNLKTISISRPLQTYWFDRITG